MTKDTVAPTDRAAKYALPLPWSYPIGRKDISRDELDSSGGFSEAFRTRIGAGRRDRRSPDQALAGTSARANQTGFRVALRRLCGIDLT
jgi:hypothetical protein